MLLQRAHRSKYFLHCSACPPNATSISGCSRDVLKWKRHARYAARATYNLDTPSMNHSGYTDDNGYESDEDSLIEEQAAVLNELRRRRLVEMIHRTKTEIHQRLNNPENSARDIVLAILRAPDPFVDSMIIGKARPSASRKCCF